MVRVVDQPRLVFGLMTLVGKSANGTRRCGSITKGDHELEGSIGGLVGELVSGWVGRCAGQWVSWSVGGSVGRWVGGWVG